MAFSSALYSPPKWVLFRLAALKQASRLIPHLTPTLAPYLREDKSERASSALLDNRGRNQDEFVFLQVDQTLFKVHVCLFRLELWRPADPVCSEEPLPDAIPSDPVVLSETVENFRYFLWDLQAFPHELLHLKDGDSDVPHIVRRLLNIAEMANKHSLTSLEARALESLRHFVLSPYFHSASSTQYCDTLTLATRSTLGHSLLRDLSRRLVHRILRQPSSPDLALVRLVEQDPRLRKIQGAIYYRQLVDMERHLDGRPGMQPTFPPSVDVERRMRFLAAHISLSALSARLCANPPPLPVDDCPSHSACLLAWEAMWTSASSAEMTLLGSADVLGRLRAMVRVLHGMVAESSTMPVECGLAALEAVGSVREGVIDGLMDHFA
ncbi:hypothetical protein B0H17DRAFT_1201695 [Mycena rosella]|uniref:BTB domain-containing protein n=1 Tax=Mycena rosella TaxID=1033263 RepID=A0AAD7DGC9_MYCRO|nr:hypothetical protein B0H17DRAFT_1201695 [Mycena rosella]